ncbi:MAG: CBS domain-containing protein, partial [Chlamydiota bacterium]
VDMVEPERARRIREIKKHERNTAGRLMKNEFFSFIADVTIGEAASYIRDHPGIDLTRRIFVVNQDGELQGYVPARNLIVNPDNLPLRQVMRPILHKVTPEVSREEVVEIVARYNISALPVVDHQDRLLGVITYEDVLESMGDIADDTIASMAGTAEKVSELEPLHKRILARAPWLVVTLCAGLINVSVMSSFQSHEGGLLTFVLFFVPLITGMSGNIGIQCSTILVRSMATGVLSVGNRTETVIKELSIGLITGFIFGVLCGILVYMLDFLGMPGNLLSPVLVGLIVGVGLFGACLTGT